MYAAIYSETEYSRETVADPIQSYFEVLHRTNSMMTRTVKFQNSKFAYSMKLQMMVA